MSWVRVPMVRKELSQNNFLNFCPKNQKSPCKTRTFGWSCQIDLQRWLPRTLACYGHRTMRQLRFARSTNLRSCQRNRLRNHSYSRKYSRFVRLRLLGFKTPYFRNLPSKNNTQLFFSVAYRLSLSQSRKSAWAVSVMALIKDNKGANEKSRSFDLLFRWAYRTKLQPHRIFICKIPLNDSYISTKTASSGGITVSVPSTLHLCSVSLGFTRMRTRLPSFPSHADDSTAGRLTIFPPVFTR